MNAIAPRPPAAELPNPLIPTTLDEAARLAKIMSDMSLVPVHLQGKPADCMLIIEQAIRWRMSPFAVAQATSVLQGKLNFEGKLVAAALHTSGALGTRLRFDYEGEGADRAVRVSSVLRGETEPREVLVKLADVKTNNSMWVKQPDQQLSYAGARIWARRHAPEVMLGVYASEEFEPAEERPEPRQVQATVVPKVKPVPKPQQEPTSLRNLAPKPTLDDALGGDVIDDSPRPYVFMTRQGPSSYGTGSELTERWRRLIEACVRTDALPKLKEAADMNRDALAAIAELDSDTAEAIRDMLAEALMPTLREERPAAPEIDAEGEMSLP